MPYYPWKKRGLATDDELGGALVDGVSLVCPFCGGQAQLGKDAKGQALGFHALPMCEKFDKLEIDEYAAAVRREFQGN